MLTVVPGPDMLRQWLPIGISLLSLTLAGLALGWNIYRDVILKARVQVSCAVISVVTPGQPIKGPRYLRITAVNHGPGPVKVQIIAGQQSSIWRRLSRRRQHFVILNDQTNPLNPKLPHKLELGDDVSLYLPYDAGCFLGDAPTHIGVTDSFGRVHYAPKSQLHEAVQQYSQEFPAKRPPRGTIGAA